MSPPDGDRPSYDDLTEHGWARDEWPAIYQQVLAADILVIAGPIWLGYTIPPHARRRLDRSRWPWTVLSGPRFRRPGQRLPQPGLPLT